MGVEATGWGTIFTLRCRGQSGWQGSWAVRAQENLEAQVPRLEAWAVRRSSAPLLREAGDGMF